MSLFPAVDVASECRSHRGVEIEWWYVFGFLGERYSLMACLWRHPGPHGGQGLMGAYALTSVREPRRWQATLIDGLLVRSARDKLRTLQRENPDPVIESVLEVLKDGRLFAPYRLAGASSLTSSEARPLEARVGELSFERANGRFRIMIDDSHVRGAIDCDLGGPAFPMGGGGTFEIDGCTMSGYTHPQCRLTARLGIDGIEERLEGRGWFDHQWGDWHLPHPTLRYQHPQWQYYALMLDDGRSFNLYRPDRPGEHGRERAPSRDLHAVLHAPDGTVRTARDVRVEALSTVESLRTHNVYEYGWRIEAPELEARFELRPFHPDHEVPVFLYSRAILELPVQVAATIAGRGASGLGFVESFGISVDIHTFFWGQRKTHLAHELERFVPRRHDPAWVARVCDSPPLALDAGAFEKALLDPIWSMMDRGGKGWRSVWLTTCCHALGHDDFDARVRELLPVVELLHTGSLVIDDVQDGSPLRRGLPALHEEIGTDLAINLGNFLYFLPLVIVEEATWLTEVQRARVYKVILNALRQGHVGQGMDLMTTRGRYDLDAKLADFDGTRRELIEQYRLKSGCQLEAIARIAGVLADAPPSRVEPLAHYSRCFGVAFQIVDDIIDMHEGRERLGKDHGEDLRNGRLNLLLFHALHAAPGADRLALAGALTGRGAPVSFEWTRELVRHTGAAETCLAEARELMESAWRGMRALPPSDATIVMRSVPLWLIEQRKRKALEIARAATGQANGDAPHGNGRAPR